MATSNVTATALPAQSALHERIAAPDFVDCYAVKSDLAPREAAQIITSFPAWARVLLLIRRMLTAPFGLSNDGPDVSDKIGIFPVDHETEREVIAGFNDKHLNFRVSVLSDNGTIYLGTWVRPHNLGGRLYLAVIMPFHVLISRNALARVALNRS